MKLNKDELRDWITGAETLKGILPASVMSLKQGYRKLTDEDLNALILYLQRLAR